MNEPKIHIAYSRNRHGFTYYSYEAWPRQNGGITKAGFHIKGANSLDEARELIGREIALDWKGREIPAIVDCGKVSAIIGTHWIY